MKQEKVRLIIDFKNKEAMLNWIEQIKAFQAINGESQPYEMGSIDLDEKVITQENTYIMATKKDRIASTMFTRRDN